MKPWTKEHELNYWTAESDDYYLANIRQKYEFFQVDKFVAQRFGGTDNDYNKLTAVDIGGGAYGGALNLGPEFKQAILVDALAPEYRGMLSLRHEFSGSDDGKDYICSKLPFGTDSITADFDNIPLKDEIADVLFAWNVFDHATNNEHFILGMLEAKRLLKPGGLFFGSFPLRKQPSPGHPVTLTEELVMRQLTREQHTSQTVKSSHFNRESRIRPARLDSDHEFKILKTFKVHEPTYRDETLFVVAEKMLRLPS